MLREKEKLPDVRNGITHRFRITDRNGKVTAGHIQTGEYEGGKIGELFLKVGKPGDDTAIYDQLAILFSVALQYGAPLENICSKLKNTQYEPSGSTSNPEIPRTTSPTDYIARYLLQKYGVKEEAVTP